MQVDIWGPNTNWGKIKDLRQNGFRPSQEDNVIVIHIIWGLKEQDRSECHHTDYKCKGKTVLDKSFDLNPPPCQNAMLVSLLLCTYWGSMNFEFALHGHCFHISKHSYYIWLKYFDFISMDCDFGLGCKVSICCSIYHQFIKKNSVAQSV